ncbi:MAG: AAA family ATPase [Chloroflexota bacterium]|jgi:general secretion pathway protein A|nr:AAA family ATPase [Anaerolineae bacterium]HMM29901.1 AAA family ATPase [Aggregatilineaceae bacterium]
MSTKLKPKLTVPFYAPDPSVTQRRLEDLQRMFGMYTYPFSMSPNPDYLYVAGVTARTLAKTTFAIDQRQGLSVIIGDYGTGKTMLARYIYSSYTAGDVREPSAVAYIPDPPHPGTRELLRRIIQELGGKTSKRTNDGLMEDLRAMVLDIFAAGQNCIVMIDEAQVLVRRQLDLIRELFNFNAGGLVPIQVVLIGKEDLRLSLHNAPDLNDRVAARSTLEPFTPAETAELINFRLNRAGCKLPLFTPDAVDLLYDLSKGYPRKAIKLAGAALWYIVEFGLERVSASALDAARLRDEIE